MSIQEQILLHIEQADIAEGFRLNLQDQPFEKIVSLSLNAKAKGHQPAIEFDNGTYISAEVLKAASIENSEIIVPGRAKFKLFKKTQIAITT